MSCPSWQWHRTGSSWSPVQTLPVAPLWCDLGFVPNSRGNKAVAYLLPTKILLLPIDIYSQCCRLAAAAHRTKVLLAGANYAAISLERLLPFNGIHILAKLYPVPCPTHFFADHLALPMPSCTWPGNHSSSLHDCNVHSAI